MNRYVLHFLAGLIIVGSILACYAHTLSVPFVFDDRIAIVENDKIRDLSNFLTSQVVTTQRPLTDLTFALNYTIVGLDVSGYHVVNIFIHIIASILAYCLAVQVLQSLGSAKIRGDRYVVILSASVAALVFALHPVQTQAVTYIAQRYTSMAAMFYMGSVLSYILGRRNQVLSFSGKADSHVAAYVKPVIFFGLCFACAVLAFLSKQNALSLPLAIVLVEYLLFDRTWAGWRKKLLIALPIAALFLGFVLYSAGVLQGDISLGRLLEETDARSRETLGVTRWQYLLTQFKVICIYLGLLVWPASQSLDYMYPFVSNILQSWTLWALLVLVSLISLGVVLRRRQPVISFAIFWFFIAISVESSIIPITDALVEHRLYLPMLGFALGFGWGFSKLLTWKKVCATFIGICILSTMGVATYARNQVWHDPQQLWAESVQANPRNYRAHYNLGLELAHKDEIKQALGHFQKAVAIWPEYAKAHYNMGRAYQRLQKPDKALKHYLMASQYNPGHIKAHLNATSILLRQREFSRAEEHLRAILAKEEDHIQALINLGVLKYARGQSEQAISVLKRAANVAPRDFTVQLNLGIVYYQQGQWARAKTHLQKAERIKPENQKVRYYLRRLRMLP